MPRKTLVLIALAVFGPPSSRSAPAPIEVDADQSFLAVRLDKGGLFSFAGHRHGILATEWSADICFDSDNPTASGAAVRVAAPALRVDTDEARTKAQLEESGPKPDDVKEIQSKMLSAEQLAASEHPEIRFRSESVEQKGDRLIFTGPLTIKGQTRQQSIPVSYQTVADGRMRFEGEFSLKQTDYGVEPVSIGGVVKVKDQVDLLFEVVGAVGEGACQ